MNAETYQNKNITTAGDSKSKTDGIIMGNIITYQRPFFIVAGSLLALLVWIALVGKNDDQHFKLSEKEIAKRVDYQVDNTNLALAKDIFGEGKK